MGRMYRICIRLLPGLSMIALLGEAHAQGAPTGLTATPASSTAISLAWTDNSQNESGFRIERAAASTGPWAQVAFTGKNVRGYINAGLAAATRYYFRVQATKANSASAYTNVASAMTPAAQDTLAPSVPAGLTAAAVSSSQINLAWNAATDNVGVAGYRVYRNGVQIASTMALVYQNSGLSAGTSHSYRVAAYDGAGNLSALSTAASATTLVAINEAPVANAGPNRVAAVGTSATFTGAASFDSDGAIAAYSWDFGDGSSASGATVSHVYAALGTFTVTLSVTDNGGRSSSDSASVEVTTPGAPPSAPYNLSASAIDSHRVQLRWAKPLSPGDGGIRNYRVYRNGQFKTTTGGPTATGSSDTFGLMHGGTYRYRISAVSTLGWESPLSNEYTVTLPAQPALKSQVVVRVLLFTFPTPDPKVDSSLWAPLPFDVATANNRILDRSNPGSFASFMSEVSFGQISVVGGVSGWFTMPSYMSDYCTFFANGNQGYGPDSFRMTRDALAVARGAGVPDLDAADILIFEFNGLGTVGLGGGRHVILSARNSGFNIGVIAHEFGHTFGGCMHGGSVTVPSHTFIPNVLNLASNGCTMGRYTDAYCPMGVYPHHYNAFHKLRMGILVEGQVATAAVGVNDYVLDQLELASPGLKMIRIPVDLSNPDTFYFLEYRRPVGFDAHVEDTPYAVPDAVFIRLRADSIAQTAGADTDTVIPKFGQQYYSLNPGTAPYHDRGLGIRVEVLRKDGVTNGGQATVRITRTR